MTIYSANIAKTIAIGVGLSLFIMFIVTSEPKQDIQVIDNSQQLNQKQPNQQSIDPIEGNIILLKDYLQTELDEKFIYSKVIRIKN